MRRMATQTEKVYTFSTLAGICPPLPLQRLQLPDSSGNRGFAAVEKLFFVKSSVINIVRAVEIAQSDFQIHDGISLSFRTVRVKHCIKKMIFCFAPTFPLLHFSVTDGGHSVTFFEIHGQRTSDFLQSPYRRKSRNGSFGICIFLPICTIGNFILLLFR